LGTANDSILMVAILTVGILMNAPSFGGVMPIAEIGSVCR
jgi:hypothetical protein